MIKTKYWAADINYIWLILPIYCTCSRHLNYSTMRTVTTLQGSGWNNILSRKGIPSSHCWKGKSRARFSTWTWRKHRAQRAAVSTLGAQWAPDRDTHQHRAQAEDHRKGVKRKTSRQFACLQVLALESKKGKEKKTRKLLWHGCILKKSQPCKTRWLQVYLFKAQFTFLLSTTGCLMIHKQ